MFGSKKPIVQENSCDSKKPLIWIYFTLLENDKSKATCKLCGCTYSLGNVVPKLQTTSNLKNHLKSRHYNEFLSFNQKLEDSKIRKEKRARENDCDLIPNTVQN